MRLLAFCATAIWWCEEEVYDTGRSGFVLRERSGVAVLSASCFLSPKNEDGHGNGRRGLFSEVFSAYYYYYFLLAYTAMTYTS